MKRWRWGLIVVLGIALYTQTPSFNWMKSLVIMSGYSAYEANHSLLKDVGVDVSIPGGMSTLKRDWYPFVITFNDDQGFSRYTGRDSRMTVLYNFGHFPFWRGYSAYYDVDSPYYNSFYGAYAIQTRDGEPFGFAEGEADISEIGLVPTYDMKWLVLSSIGVEIPVFDYEVTQVFEAPLLGGEEWFCFDADMLLNGSAHSYKKDYRAYIQYGIPPARESEIPDYPLVKMRGRIYGKYFEKQDISLFFYCIATDDDVIEEWERTIMAQTEVRFE